MATDITYIPTAEGWLYLAVFIDLFTRKVVGFSTADHMRTELVLNALDMALGRQRLIEGQELISHPDRGSQYAAQVYRDRLNDLGMTVSHSRRANCYDNAFAESFFHTLKVELVHRSDFKTKKEARSSRNTYNLNVGGPTGWLAGWLAGWLRKIQRLRRRRNLSDFGNCEEGTNQRWIHRKGVLMIEQRAAPSISFNNFIFHFMSF